MSTAAQMADLERQQSPSSEKEVIKRDIIADTDNSSVDGEEKKKESSARLEKLKPWILAGTAALILGWWISATILPATRHRWIVQTIFAWFFILLIFFQFVPSSIFWQPLVAIYEPTVAQPFFRIPYRVRLTMGWACLLGIVFGSAFGFPLPDASFFKYVVVLTMPTVIIGLFFQQVVALFVLKTGAGFSIFKWIATLASDFLSEANPAAQFFFDADTIAKHWFFVNTLAAIIFFIAFVQMMYYLGVMQFIIKKFAYFFFKTMNISGAEAVVAAASPWIGQGESACLVRPFVDLSTESELHLFMASGFSTISGSVLTAYINLGVPPHHHTRNLVTSSVMSIPASIAISKMRIPEMDEPVTRGRVVVDRGREEKGGAPANALHAFSKGATFGLIVAGQILTNVLTVLALVYTINGLLTWIGRGFGIHQLTLELILGYVFYPVTFFMGVPRPEIIQVARLLATKFYANEFVAYMNLHAIMTSDTPLTPRAFTIASYALCGFANLGSLGIQIGVLSALAPSRGRVIARIAPSAMACGFIATMQTAAIA
ncbi:hypothetical protein Clacol_000388 [Clathrus columnatus]|uniref:Sodium/nucleoside cotransporter n=1 Tax=Clathrus columnatus TaxID=1419009 RepID=A0AAV4ZYY7_9AGAM|nr:hypothetical protein Clacol_000388 [Clathrus columnatus]